MSSTVELLQILAAHRPAKNRIVPQPLARYSANFSVVLLALNNHVFHMSLRPKKSKKVQNSLLLHAENFKCTAFGTPTLQGL